MMSVIEAATWHLKKSQRLTLAIAVISVIIALIEHLP